MAKAKKPRNLKAGKKLEQQKPLITKTIDAPSPTFTKMSAPGKHY